MSSISILLVEPDRDERARARALLEREGYTVLEAPDAPHALDIVRRREIALVITELYLPSTDEPCLVHAIRGLRVLHRTNVLAFTRHSTAADRAWALAEGADGYVLKKNGFARLLEVVSHLGVPTLGRRSRMRRARMRRARAAQEG